MKKVVLFLLVLFMLHGFPCAQKDLHAEEINFVNKDSLNVVQVFISKGEVVAMDGYTLSWDIQIETEIILNKQLQDFAFIGGKKFEYYLANGTRIEIDDLISSIDPASSVLQHNAEVLNYEKVVDPNPADQQLFTDSNREVS